MRTGWKNSWLWENYAKYCLIMTRKCGIETITYPYFSVKPSKTFHMKTLFDEIRTQSESKVSEVTTSTSQKTEDPASKPQRAIIGPWWNFVHRRTSPTQPVILHKFQNTCRSMSKFAPKLGRTAPVCNWLVTSKASYDGGWWQYLVTLSAFAEICSFHLNLIEFDDSSNFKRRL